MFIQSFKLLAFTLSAILLTGCASSDLKDDLFGPGKNSPTLMPRTSTYTDLISLPEPKGKIVASIYSFTDQTGQYRGAPNSSFSTMVTQGATAMLNTALRDSGWFIPLEREGLQNLLTERKIIRATMKQQGQDANQLAALLPANVLLEGGIIAYETNTRTGGAGLKYLGIGTSEKYRVDQITINLRAVDVRSGQILHSINVTKTILSNEVQAGIYKYVAYKELLETEAGYTTNEPVQLSLMSAIEAAVIHLITEGITTNSWALKNTDEIESEVVKQYLNKTSPVVL
ncbi:curli production assembly/transport protein CsgG [Endozoicomonas sp. OPT23]|uniref:CsgG/HfaB family protein n=1 Tax=Endozoicomonas sp. OPT23 TaxID=2072845 RepID=UPI00129A5CC1|nr:CsgG/HfaB family protein [Endozoicomonas sp. OPT23]MRI33139.1 curli production assembly/transport protein CsgG [Endozoicomonas sp. OPT23]